MSKRPDYLPNGPNGYPVSSHVRRNQSLVGERAERLAKTPVVVNALLKRFTHEELAARCGVSRNYVFEMSYGHIAASKTTLKILEGLQ